MSPPSARRRTSSRLSCEDDDNEFSTPDRLTDAAVSRGVELLDEEQERESHEPQPVSDEPSDAVSTGKGASFPKECLTAAAGDDEGDDVVSVVMRSCCLVSFEA